MSWLIRHNGVEASSDDFLIDDLAQIEKSTGTPWSVANPWRDVKVARAFLAAAMLRAGRGEEEVATALSLLTLKQLKTVFKWVDDDEPPAGEDGQEAPLDRPSPTSRGSSSGEPARAGRPVRSVSSG